ncbi:MAG TPA: hypothetical protein VMW16_03955 [Sedimentisphaerales bacterium]|nr:hypothetical protein [Sedimentisphaerales bacterium]
MESVKVRNPPEADKSGGGNVFFDRPLGWARGDSWGALGRDDGERLGSVGMTMGGGLRSG